MQIFLPRLSLSFLGYGVFSLGTMLKCQFSPNLTYRFSTISIKCLSRNLFVETDELILKYIQKYKGPRIVRIILKKKVGGHTILDIQTFNSATVNKAVRSWCRTDKWNGRKYRFHPEAHIQILRSATSTAR